MCDLQREIARLFRTIAQHGNAENAVISVAIARFSPGDGNWRQHLQNKGVGKQDAGHVPRQISKPLPPAAAFHGLPTQHIRPNT